MAGVSRLATRGIASVPGILSIKRDADGRIASSPLPWAFGPTCERCWLDVGLVKPVRECRHGETP